MIRRADGGRRKGPTHLCLFGVMFRCTPTKNLEAPIVIHYFSSRYYEQSIKGARFRTPRYRTCILLLLTTSRCLTLSLLYRSSRCQRALTRDRGFILWEILRRKNVTATEHRKRLSARLSLNHHLQLLRCTNVSQYRRLCERYAV